MQVSGMKPIARNNGKVPDCACPKCNPVNLEEGIADPAQHQEKSL
jgi:hypothetical protein